MKFLVLVSLLISSAGHAMVDCRQMGSAYPYQIQIEFGDLPTDYPRITAINRLTGQSLKEELVLTSYKPGSKNVHLEGYSRKTDVSYTIRLPYDKISKQDSFHTTGTIISLASDEKLEIDFRCKVQK